MLDEEEYSPLMDVYFKKGNVAVFAFTVSSRKSFEGMKHFIDLVTKRRDDLVMIAVGTEISKEDPRVVTFDEARAFFESMNPPIHYMEASTMTGENVKGILEYGIREWRSRGFDVNQNDNEKKRSCIIC